MEWVGAENRWATQSRQQLRHMRQSTDMSLQLHVLHIIFHQTQSLERIGPAWGRTKASKCVTASDLQLHTLQYGMSKALAASHGQQLL